MKFHVEHTFRGIDLPAYERLFFDEPFNIELCKHTKLGRTLVKLEDKDGRRLRVVRVAPERDIPAPVAKVLGTTKLEFTESVDYQLGAGSARWSSEPSILRDKVESRGTFSFQVAPGGVRRVVDGVVNVKIFGVGGLVERFVVADIEKSYDKAAEFTQRWIDEHGVPA
jgi:hypothetical protein